MKKIIGLFIMGLILSSCTSEDGNEASKNLTNENRYSFTGISESWEVSFEVAIIDKEQGENLVDEKGTAKFIGEGEAPKAIDYKLETETGINSLEGTGEQINNGVGDFAQGSCGNCVPIQVDEKLELEIIWDGKSEKILLTPDK